MHRFIGLCAAIVTLAFLPSRSSQFDSPRAEAGPALQRYESVEPHMGTLVRITLYAPGAQAAEDAFRAAFDRIRALDAILSDYRPDSELNHITQAAVGRP